MTEGHKDKGFTVMDMDQRNNIRLPQVFTRKTISFKSSRIRKPEVAMCWEHLKPIAKWSDAIQERLRSWFADRKKMSKGH